jgi:hypothetical protein
MVVARDEMIDQSMSSNNSTFSGGGIGGTLRRSLRQINPFKNRLFRLPATPRLTRSRKGEETTNWNFERPISNCYSVGRQAGANMYTSVVTNPINPVESPENSAMMTVPAHLRNLPPQEENRLVGGSCKVRSTRHSRPPLPSYVSTQHPVNTRSLPLLESPGCKRSGGRDP